ncbi:MAG: SH3 domain-containing protein [Anaerolineae bacterium]|jgi:uncharacterized protein YgiM (DUF1202 family)|nr:SH3 domain-containing protein [Anaerolineae bacterium]
MLARKLLTAALLLLALLLALPAAAQTFSAEVARADGTNILNGPGRNFRVLAGVGPGYDLNVVGRNADGSWLEVVTPNRRRTGWVNITHVETTGDVLALPQTAFTTRTSAVVNTAFQNLRTGPGANFDVIVQLRGSTWLNVIGRNAENSWVLVQTADGLQGWVSTRFTTINFTITDVPEVSVTGTLPPFEPPVPVGNSQVAFVTTGANVRYGPGTQYSLMTTLDSGEGVFLRGRNTPATWLFVQIDSGDSGWIRADLLNTTFPVDTLPVVGNA